MIVAADISMHVSGMGYQVLGILARGEDAVQCVKENSPDLVLVDIHLKGSMDGVQFVKEVRKVSPGTGIIYLTANADEASFNRAKETRPEAFISKPFKRLDLSRAIELAVLRMSGATTASSNEAEIPDSHFLKDRIFMRDRDKLVKVFLEEILYAEADRNYCKVFTDQRQYLMTLPLKAFEQKIQSENFLRIHRSYIVNLTKVETISEGCEFLSVGSRSIPVSRSFKPGLMKRLKLI